MAVYIFFKLKVVFDATTRFILLCETELMSVSS